MKRFGVALWLRWLGLFPEWCADVEAASAFEAITLLMEQLGLERVAKATAIAFDGSIRYRAFDVKSQLRIIDEDESSAVEGGNGQ